ncbi:MAG: hypothetical protein EOP83_35655 [Verrucomicrobiaceae bacterium]|nr:MAG: hypothetical protein EOP83_35655 [Verrucomicrobiaceae bacterium]
MNRLEHSVDNLAADIREERAKAVREITDAYRHTYSLDDAVQREAARRMEFHTGIRTEIMRWIVENTPNAYILTGLFATNDPDEAFAFRVRWG